MKFERKNRKTVAVIYGGRGVEHDVSLLGAKYVLDKIDTAEFLPVPLLIDRDGELWYVEKGKEPIPASLVRRKNKSGILIKDKFKEVDVAFPILHGDFGEDGKIQGLLESLKIAFVGCDTVAGAVASDKGYTKAVAESIGIKTVPGLALDTPPTDEFIGVCEEKFGYPVFVKPARLGSSVGAGIAHTKDELTRLLRVAGELGGTRVLVEKYLDKPRELECAFLELGGKKFITPPGEITNGSGFYDYSEKYGKNSSAKIQVCSDVDDEQVQKLLSYADAIVSRLGIRAVSRVDFFLHGGEIYFNEINTMPGMTEASLYPKLIEGIGISATHLINGLIRDAAENAL